jgi:hypothetical protein
MLTDGRVLIVGNFASAQLYDPVTGTFAATGDRTTPGFSSCTLLPNGKVLIAGSGISGADGLYTSSAHAELYDPETGTFAPTGDMTVERVGGTATLLNNGKVLITGGTVVVGGSPTLYLASAELYDPSTGTFTAAADMYEAFSDTATLLPNGKVLITRSIVTGAGEAFVRHAELYDPSTGTFTFTGDMTTGHTTPTATLLTNGKVLIAGGDVGDGDAPSNIAELYDPATGTFTTTGNMTTRREQHTATLLSDGTVLIAGGHIERGASAEIYDPVTGTFSATGDMTASRELHTATLLSSGKVLIAGGYDWPTILSSAEIYNPPLLVPPPMLLSLSGDGQGQGAIQHAGTTRITSADDPAIPGEYLSIYLNGLVDGSVIPPQVAIGGRSTDVTFFGNVPGYPGLNVVNIRMPSTVAPGPAVPVRLTYLGRSSNQVTIGVTLEVALQQAATAMKTAAGTDSLNFWQWAWYWQNLPPFSGAPAGFGVVGSISIDLMTQIITAGRGDPLRNVSAEQWVSYFRRIVPQ